MRRAVLTTSEQMEQRMLYDGPHRLAGTWRTWVRGDSGPFTFVTQHKNDGWSPNYWSLIAGGQGQKSKIQPREYEK